MTTTEQETTGVTVVNPQQAVSLLIQGVQVAQQRGAYQLNEASVLSEAVTFLTGRGPTAETSEDSTTETEETTEDVESTEEATEN